MRLISGNILLSASDLMRFMGCTHATTLDLLRLHGHGPAPRTDSADTALLQKHGDVHEAAHLTGLQATREVVEIERGNLAENAAATREALASGAEVIFQGAFLSGNWGGWSDFLERVERPSALGDFSYEVADTKLKRRPHPKHVLQLVLYSDLLTEIQGVAPEFAHVELGDGTRATLRLADYAAYARMARARLEGFVADPQPTRPTPCADCGLCRWGDHCAGVWQTEDSLFNVANISRGQVKKLEAAGVRTMEALASLDHPIRGMAENTRLRLVTQARLQHARKTGVPTFELRAPEPGKGFDLLPEPQAGDLFYDIEGNPHYEGGLEYLHGVWCDGQFRSFWAHDHAAEGRALAELLEFFRARLAAYPDARICRFISDQVYEGRLESHPDTARQAVTGTSFPEAGAFWVEVAHEGNAQIAPEEVAAVAATAADLLKGTWTDKDGQARPVRQSDIIVVAPYNAQVNALRDALPEGIRVGTVDKFQGQEAPVCLVSMTASSAEETPRGMEFLFSLNRINVAVSRAKGLALVFGAPRLREAKCETVEQMRLVNTLCALNTPCSPPTVPSGAIPPALLAALKAQKA
ncbi:TM0106 family RecB-like putative nuclease [Paracoccus sp. (in: a-proteobacteria)]|uniref:TM0106 family RecB-like putative nuclease n=1 Tax=Paracoccus sp. TaxID=267 RepID=UPI0032201318